MDVKDLAVYYMKVSCGDETSKNCAGMMRPWTCAVCLGAPAMASWLGGGCHLWTRGCQSEAWALNHGRGKMTCQGHSVCLLMKDFQWSRAT